MNQQNYDQNAEYCHARDMANKINFHMSNLAITLSTGAIVFGISLKQIFPISDIPLKLTVLLVCGWLMFVMCILFGIVDLFLRRKFWQNLAHYQNEKLHDRECVVPETKSPDWALNTQIGFFMLGIVSVFLYALSNLIGWPRF